MVAFAPSSFLGSSIVKPSSLQSSRIQPAVARQRPVSKPSMSSNVLIVNTKGGGHGHLGLHLAQTLLEQGHKVHVHQIGGEDSCAPVKQYPNLATTYPSAFSVAYGDIPASLDATGPYDAIYDNNAKSLADIEPAITAASGGNTELFYVSSAGAYAYDANVAPHMVGDAAKGPTIEVEDAIRAAGVSSVNFRPIYMIGPHTSKREYVDFFFDRLSRDRPIPLPGCGEEITSITDVRDIAALLAGALNKGLKDETINAVNVRGVTFDAMVKMCAEVCGKEAKIVRYDVKEVEGKVDGFKAKKAFPFRPRHFFADTWEGQEKIGWKANVSGSAEGLAASIKACYEEYLQLGLDKASVDFALDDKILACVE